MYLQVSSAPAAEPVTSAEFKLWARIGYTADDALITDLLTGARKWLESRLNRAFVTQTITLQLDSSEAVSPIWLRRSPVQSITSVKEWDTDNETWGSAISSDNYELISADPARLMSDDDGWSLNRTYNALQIIYVAGYGAAAQSPELIPEPILTAIKMKCAEMYEQRQETQLGVTAAKVADALEIAEEYNLDPFGLYFG